MPKLKSIQLNSLRYFLIINFLGSNVTNRNNMKMLCDPSYSMICGYFLNFLAGI